MAQTKVISARVPVDVATAFEKACKQKGVSKSKYLTEIVSTPNFYEIQTMSTGGEIEKFEMPEEIQTVLSASGGLLIGTLVFKSIKSGLQNRPHLSDEDINLYAILGAVACGLGSAFGIDAMMKSSGK